MHGRLHGKIVLILEGEGEIAAATAVRFAREGARVALCGRDAESLEETATAVADVGGSAYVMQADAGHEAQLSAVLDEAVGQFGMLDVLVCCPPKHGTTKTAGESTARKALVTMAARGGGSIVLVAPSTSDDERPNGDTGRAALEAATRRLAVEGASHAVRANLVVPGLIQTEHRLASLADPAARKAAEQAVPLGRFGRPDEIAAAIAFLASDDASYITGATVTVDGGRYARRHAAAPIQD
jgi:meso-butanediol dehydrogenase/(S,S)-butanediol dehydrogenase/diacetyl reductase